jgi:hypothetical protein
LHEMRPSSGWSLRATASTALAVLLCTSACAGQPEPATASAADSATDSPIESATASAAGDEAAIRGLVAEHYVTAVFRTRDEGSVRRGFHPEFQLYVLDDGQLIVAPLEMWLDRLGLDGVTSGSDVRHEVVFVDVEGDAAVLRTELFVDGEHEYTDYFSLYRFSSGWRIVTKIFQSY